MKISLNWLKKFVEIPENISAKELAQLFTIRTAEVEGVINEGELLHKIVVGKILSIQPHPNADKLRVTQTQVDKDTTLQIVCGAKNIKENMYVIVALPGSRVRWHGEGDLITLETTQLRGIESHGMICGADEVGLPPPSDPNDDVPDLATYELTKDYIFGENEKSIKPGTPLSFVLNKNDIILEIDNKSLTHRPDLWGHYGIAREMAAIFGTHHKPYDKAVQLAKIETTEPSPLTVEIKDKEICPRFTALVMKNIKVKESPEWLKQDLIKVGVRPVNNIVDITNHIMLGLGQPMHAYDRKVVGTDKLEIRLARENESLETIDHKHHKLSQEDPIITNGTIPLTIAGIMGGAHSEINDDTTEVILEAANWHPATVRKASQRNGLRTDALQRFEKSLDPEMTLTAILRAAALIQKLCPKAEIVGGIIDHYPTKIPTKTIEVSPEKIQQKIGDAITVTEMKDILKRLQFKITASTPKKITIEVPSFRATKDIVTEDDIAEEIARMHGYEKIPALLPSLPTKLPKPYPSRILEHQTRSVLSQILGFSEVYSFSFYGAKELANARLPEDLHLQIQNPLSADQTHVRISLVPNLLKTITSNLRFKKALQVYEIGRTYIEEHEYFAKEELWVVGVIVTEKNSSQEAFLDAKGAVDIYLHTLGIPATDWGKAQSSSTAHPHIHSTRTTPSGQQLAHVYDLHPIVAKNFELQDYNIAIFEINLTSVTKEKLIDRKYRPIPRHPGIEFDVAILIDKKTPSQTIKEKIESADPALIKDVSLFDHYEGSNIEPDKKSLAYRILLQSDDRTLTDEDMTKTQKTITENLAVIGGIIR